MPNACKPAVSEVSNEEQGLHVGNGRRTCATALHHLIITRLVGGYKDDLGPKAGPRILEKLHAVWPTPTLLRVPQDHPLGLDVFVDQAGYRGAEGSLLVGTDPYEEPRSSVS